MKTKQRLNASMALVLSCIRFYRAKGVRLKFIYLSDLRWLLFKDGMLRIKPELEAQDFDKIAFGDVIVGKGSKVQTEPLIVEFHEKRKLLTKAQA